MVPSENVRIATLQRKLQKEVNTEKQVEIQAELEKVIKVCFFFFSSIYTNLQASLFKSYRVAKLLLKELPSIVYHNNGPQVQKILNSRETLTSHECYVPSVNYLSEKCFDLKVSL